MASPAPSSDDADRAALGRTVAQTFHADLACLACADAVDHALRRTPSITEVHVN
jgi:hypothetical protein